MTLSLGRRDDGPGEWDRQRHKYQVRLDGMTFEEVRNFLEREPGSREWLASMIVELYEQDPDRSKSAIYRELRLGEE